MSDRLLYSGTVDPNTGLPQVPEDHFWRVQRRTRTSAYVYVELCTTKQGFFGKKIVVVEDSILAYENLSEDEIWDRSVLIMNRLEKRAENVDRSRLLGIYPPKKLGA